MQLYSRPAAAALRAQKTNLCSYLTRVLKMRQSKKTIKLLQKSTKVTKNHVLLRSVYLTSCLYLRFNSFDINLIYKISSSNKKLHLGILSTRGGYLFSQSLAAPHLKW